MKMLKHLDLCSSNGGFAVGFSMAKLSEPIAFCDRQLCQKVLAKNFPNIPIYDDVKEIADDPTRFIWKDQISSRQGYPCQPFSTSGKGGTEDPRHIFPYLHKIIEQVRPTYCVFENVMDTSHWDLTRYSLQWKLQLPYEDICTRLVQSEQDTTRKIAGSFRNWATLTTMDSLPRSAEATKKARGHRVARDRAI